jgi:hypothetical protein
MASEWQNLAALAIVLAAAAYLIRRAWLTLAKKRASGCGACASCPAASANPAGKSLMQLEAFVKPQTKS